MPDLTVMLPIVVMNFPSPVWEGAFHLVMAETGRLLAVDRGDPLKAAAARLVNEGYGRSSTVTIRCAHSLVPDITGTIADALAAIEPAGELADREGATPR